MRELWAKKTKIRQAYSLRRRHSKPPDIQVSSDKCGCKNVSGPFTIKAITIN